MNYAPEVKASFGEDVLATVQRLFGDDWNLLGFDMRSVFVGNDKIAASISRKDARVSEKHKVVFRKSDKNKR